MMTLNLALLFVFQLAARQLFFWHRENLFHRVSEFLGRLLLGRCRHDSTIHNSMLLRNHSVSRERAHELYEAPSVAFNSCQTAPADVLDATQPQAPSLQYGISLSCLKEEIGK